MKGSEIKQAIVEQATEELRKLSTTRTNLVNALMALPKQKLIEELVEDAENNDEFTSYIFDQLVNELKANCKITFSASFINTNELSICHVSTEQENDFVYNYVNEHYPELSQRYIEYIVYQVMGAVKWNLLNRNVECVHTENRRRCEARLARAEMLTECLLEDNWNEFVNKALGI